MVTVNVIVIKTNITDFSVKLEHHKNNLYVVTKVFAKNLTHVVVTSVSPLIY